MAVIESSFVNSPVVTGFPLAPFVSTVVVLVLLVLSPFWRFPRPVSYEGHAVDLVAASLAASGSASSAVMAVSSVSLRADTAEDPGCRCSLC